MYASSARRPRSSRSTGPNPPTGSPPASALGVWKRRGEARCRARRAGQRLPHAPRTHHGLLHVQGRRTPLSNRCPTLASLAYGPPVGPECPTKHTARAPVNDGQRDPQRSPRQHVTAEGGVTALDEHPGAKGAGTKIRGISSRGPPPLARRAQIPPPVLGWGYLPVRDWSAAPTQNLVDPGGRQSHVLRNGDHRTAGLGVGTNRVVSGTSGQNAGVRALVVCTERTQGCQTLRNRHQRPQ